MCVYLSVTMLAPTYLDTLDMVIHMRLQFVAARKNYALNKKHELN